MATTWYLGVPGDLRALFCPERDIEVTELRFGGVHQSLGGARTMDVTGIKQQYSFNWQYLDVADYKWLRALHTRLLRGPHRLIDPLKVNRLSIGASKSDITPHRWPYFAQSGGTLEYANDYPTGILGERSIRWFDRTASSAVALDITKMTDVFPLETVTVSAYLKGDSAVSVDMYVAWYDKDYAFISNSSVSTHSVTTSWDRYSATKTAPANAVLGVFTMAATATTAFKIAAPQFETGSSATTWEEGGANPMVLIDQLTTISPRYPVSNCALVLLEA